MSYFLFVDESGHDRKLAPAEVLGGFCIRDGALWSFIQKVQALQEDVFGISYSQLNRLRREKAKKEGRVGEVELKEIKGTNFLNPLTIRRARWAGGIRAEERTKLAYECLMDGAKANKRAIAALSQAKLDYVLRLFDLCAEFKAKCLGLIVPVDAPGDRRGDELRKDYAYLFERFFYFVESTDKMHVGIIVFDELDKVASHILLNQMEKYHVELRKGQAQAEQILPEPFFVHSDLTIGVQVADFIAYILSWGHNFDRNAIVPKPRAELAPYFKKVMELELKTAVKGRPGIDVIANLSTRRQTKKGNAA